MVVVKLFCVLVGAQGIVFSVIIDANKSVTTLKDAIKAKKPDTIKCEADKVQLFLAKKDGAWLPSKDPDVVSVRSGVIPEQVKKLLKDEIDPAEEIGDLFRGVPTKKTIHVLVVVPESSASEATVAPTPVTFDQVEMAMNKVLEERDQRVSVYSISTCMRSKEERLVRKLGYQYKTIDVTEEIDGSIDPYPWQENVVEDHEHQRRGYMQYFKDNLQGVLHQDGSTITPPSASPRLNTKYYLKDTSQTKNLLDCDVPSSLPFRLKGTTEVTIIDETAKSMDEVFAGLRFVIEINKKHHGAKERCQIFLELVAAGLKSEKCCAPIGLLTNLNGYWYFLWFAPDREIARMKLSCPANGFKMVKELLTVTTKPLTEVFPMRIRFLSLPLQKRQKLIEAAPAGDDAATEMMERYELMSDELSPEFLLARRMEYEFRKVREMPIHSGMFS